MMQKRLVTYMLAATTLLLAACTGVEEAYEGAGARQQEAAGSQPVNFGAYLRRGTHRAGAAGTLTTTGSGSGEVSLQTEGFGVIGFYTDEVPYSTLALPNFMYNQHVTYNSLHTAWEYEPVKYWPNEAQDDRLSFFAYAPYAAVTPSTGVVTGDALSGISALTSAAHAGDPLLRYYAALTPSECVDLCWATPQKNLTKPSVSSKVDFSFKHALASLNVQVKTDVDDGGTLDGQTRVWIRRISFDGFDLSGMLSLASEDTPTWYDVLGGMQLGIRPATIHDGRKDGREGALASTTETPAGLNPQLVQSAPYTTSPSLTTTTTGVTGVAQNLFNDELSATAPVFVIPTGAPMRVTIVYDVETYDPLLTGNFLNDGRTHGRTIQNNLTATVTTDGTAPLVMTAGNRYTLTLTLGLTSVKTTVTMTGWGGSTEGSGELPDDPGEDPDPDVPVGVSNSIDSWGSGGSESEEIH